MVKCPDSATREPLTVLIGFISAISLLLTILIEDTVWAVLPLPWRLIPWSFIFALAIMHRVSFELGAAFFLSSVLLTVLTGLAPLSSIAIALLCLAAAYGFVSRVFARRSLPAFTGLALATSLMYFIFRFGVVSSVPGFFPWMYLFLAAITTLLSVMASLGLEWTLRAFGRRFVTKNETYEVQAPR